MIGTQEASVVLGLEAAETYRMREYINDSTWIVMNERRIPPVSVNLGREEYPSNAELLTALAKLSSRVVSVPALPLAIKAGSRRVENVVMLGTLAALGCLPFGSEKLRKAMESLVPARWLEVNQEAFSLGLRHGEQVLAH